MFFTNKNWAYIGYYKRKKYLELIVHLSENYIRKKYLELIVHLSEEPHCEKCESRILSTEPIVVSVERQMVKIEEPEILS